MIFFAANDGTIIKSLPSPVYQGSSNANTIYLVAPFASNLSVTVRFQLPNGVWTTPYLMKNGLVPNEMTPQGELASSDGAIVDKETGKTYAVWTYALPSEITAYYGTVTAQFFFYAAQAGVVTASSATSFTVGRGVPAILPDTPSENIYQEILGNFSSLEERLDNGSYVARGFAPWNPVTVYGANEYVFYPNYGQYGAIIKSLVPNNTAPPFTESGNLNRSYWQITFDLNQMRRAIVAWGFNDPSLISEIKWEVA